MTVLLMYQNPWLTRSWLISLTFAALLVDLGCSHLRSKPQSINKSELALGEELPGRDIYAKRSAPRSDGQQIARSKSSDSRAEVDFRSKLDDSDLAGQIELPERDAVQLQPPIRDDQTKMGTLPTSAGVPDSVRLIAASRIPSESPAVPASSASPSISEVVSQARITINAMSTYQLSLKRQERVNGVLLPVEDLIMSIRRNPKAARLTWVDGPHKGREVLYQANEPGGLMHVNMADSKIPMPRLALAPDSPLVMKNSRHPITEAGLDPIIASMEQANQAGSLVDLGLLTPARLDRPHHGILRKTTEGDTWRAYFDPATHLPTLVDCQASNGDLLEQYLFENIQPNLPELARVEAFDPVARWGAPRGLFGRMVAKGADSPDAASTR